MAVVHRIHNFSAGPATLPLAVLQESQAGLFDYEGSGMGVMEMSHRSRPFEAIIDAARDRVRRLLGVPAGYEILFLAGGASLQFAQIPMAFARGGRAEYVVTGSWGERAIESARAVGNAGELWTGLPDGYRTVPGGLMAPADAPYLHMTTNETIQGVQYPDDPQHGVRVVADCSSDFMSRPTDVSRYAMLYAGAQKNLGPAGVTVAILSSQLLATHAEGLPPMLDYRVHVKNQSLYNTPATWSIYVTGLVLKWIESTGGLGTMAERNQAKAAVLYAAIDGSGGFYRGHAAPEARSLMNVTFTLPSADLTREFVTKSETAGLSGLAGHRSVGGIRASIYNAMEAAGVQALADFMAEFAQRHG